MKDLRPACVPEQFLAQLDHLPVDRVVLFEYPSIHPLGEPGRLSLIDPLDLTPDAHDPVDEEFLGRIARPETEPPGPELILIVPKDLRRQDHDIRPAAVIEG